MDVDKDRGFDAPPPYTPMPTVPQGYQPYTYPPPPPPLPQWQYGPGYGATAVIVNPQVAIQAGECPACRIGFLQDDYTCLGIFCAIFFFPLGIIACLLLRNRRCCNCGAYFS